MDVHLSREEMLAKMNETKSIEIDPYGLSKFDRKKGEIDSQVTDFDSFLFQDALQLISLSQEEVDKFKLAPETLSKFDLERKLYRVTVGDSGTTYYDYATMFNRFTNPIYAGKVHKSSELFRQYMSRFSMKIDQEIKSSMNYNMTEAMRRDEGRGMGQ